MIVYARWEQPVRVTFTQIRSRPEPGRHIVVICRVRRQKLSNAAEAESRGILPVYGGLHLVIAMKHLDVFGVCGTSSCCLTYMPLTVARNR
jgi:hypothetical protein